MKIIFFGAGYCSKYIIKNLSKKTEIICTHNQEIKKESFDSKFNLKRLKLSDFIKKKNIYLENTTHILNSIPPNKNGDLILQKVTKKELKKLPSLVWLGYFSSTSVYGNHDGKWVDELSLTNPTTSRGSLRLNAELQYLELLKNNIPIHIFRLPGIYGLGRSQFEKIKSKNYFAVKKNNHFFSRIHVEDIANAITKSFKNPTPGEIFNITDDYPCESLKPLKFACKLMKIKLPEIIEINDQRVNQMTKSFYLDNKRVSNKKIKKILNWTPKYRNYKLGLKKIFENLQK